MPHSSRPSPRSRSPEVVAGPARDLGLEYTSFDKQVIPGCGGRSFLLERMINTGNVEIDVMEGYDPRIARSVNKHSIYHLYEFESQTRFLDRIRRNTTGSYANHELMSTRFLVCRYVICLLDDAMQKHQHVELMAMRLNGDIYIGANKSSDFGLNDQNGMAFGGLKFAKKITTGDPSLDRHHSVVKELRLENLKTRTGMCIYVSSIVRAFDKRGDTVELKTVSSKVEEKLQNLSRLKARSWWLRALLSGSNRIVYGVRRPDRIVHRVNEACIRDFTNGHFHFNPSNLFEYVFKLFEKISFSIPDEGDMCLVNTDGGEPTIVITDADSLKRSPFW